MLYPLSTDSFEIILTHSAPADMTGKSARNFCVPSISQFRISPYLAISGGATLAHRPRILYYGYAYKESSLP